MSLASLAGSRAIPSGVSDSQLTQRREKARERQRKKRERDRSGAASVIHPSAVTVPLDLQDPLAQQQAIAAQAYQQPPMDPEELSRKEKIRIAARERQRKHRAVVKARRMAELGLVMPTNPSDPLGYRVNENGEMEAVHDANAPGGPDGSGYPATPGQTFARLLMTSATLNHNLKHHLLRTMQMTNEELESFEPIIAAAWDHWNHQRMHYIQSQGQVASATSPYNPSDGGHDENAVQDPNLQYTPDQANEYRNRFHKTLTDPTPFQQVSASGSIDPSLAAQAVRETSSLRTEGHGEVAEGTTGELDQKD